jgi:hypothetical protein
MGSIPLDRHIIRLPAPEQDLRFNNFENLFHILIQLVPHLFKFEST